MLALCMLLCIHNASVLLLMRVRDVSFDNDPLNPSILFFIFVKTLKSSSPTSSKEGALVPWTPFAFATIIDLQASSLT